MSIYKVRPLTETPAKINFQIKVAGVDLREREFEQKIREFFSEYGDIKVYYRDNLHVSTPD